ncbi:MAG: hypothetical protein APG12_00400 [Candidatus Methanofastidiosum methylothiophilum]|uniref:Uncharacterized protein n=1 Tax=Candidatus Methanofastidiosum methylothiophilum TaxID=1705564 RepID=A0A150J188_9EURY|nr:MAG: hypothetical protein APG10_00281 [Candidatus Methanofastidiosum methylthiophilus]KYC48308.1 MAG: hypothetical protein APG11_00431 [Candidatus Methanofastidiosum methylthiophilus]KYC50977.1 MAG: hypothetical protein APG12_00400 [Candidatus Methanofastidiosum methylthiophilus]
MNRKLRMGISLFLVLFTLTLFIAYVAAEYESSSQHYRFQMKFLGTEGTVRPDENLRISDVRFIINKDTITLKMNVYIPRNSGIDRMEMSFVNDPDRSKRFFLEPAEAKGVVSSIKPLYMNAANSYFLRDGDVNRKVSLLTLTYKRVGDYYYQIPLNATVDSFYGEFWIVFDKGTNDPSILLENNNINISFSYPYGDAGINGIKVPDEYTIKTVTPETTERVKSFIVYYSAPPNSVFIEAVKGQAEPTALEKLSMWGNSNLGIFLIIFTFICGIDSSMVFLSSWKKSFGNKNNNGKVKIKKEEFDEKPPPQERTVRPKPIPAPIERERPLTRTAPSNRYQPYPRVDTTKDLIDDIKRLEKAMEDYENSVKYRNK